MGELAALAALEALERLYTRHKRWTELLAVQRKKVELASDPQIAHAAVLLILFTADPTVAAHDLGVWAARASAHALPLWPRVERSLAIGDRVGHRVCTLALWPIERRG